jgi:hypothetical protein
VNFFRIHGKHNRSKGLTKAACYWAKKLAENLRAMVDAISKKNLPAGNGCQAELYFCVTLNQAPA